MPKQESKPLNTSTSSNRGGKRPPDQYREPQGTKGPSYSSHKMPGDFMAESILPRSSRYLRTRHHTLEAAQKRLDGNLTHHEPKIIDLRLRKPDGSLA